MPSTYAHYRFGQEIKQHLIGREKRIVEKYSELFDIGLHGPDILFYYRPIKSNPVNSVGFGTHAKPGKDFFIHAIKVINRHKKKERYMAYAYGVICHFALDMTCHGYVDEKIAESGISHTEIEVEFDRELMLHDGLDPLRQSLTDHIKPTYENERVIAQFYPGVTAKNVHRALRGMIFYNRLLIAPSRIKRKFINFILKITGNYKEIHGLFVNFEKNPKCADSTLKLMSLYHVALKRAMVLIEEFGGDCSNICCDENSLNDLYRYTFGSKLLDEKEN